jgi:hypothetical protein
MKITIFKTTALIMSLTVLFSTAQAEEEKKIYKYTDENGVTHYTETKPNEDYEEADLPSLSIVPSAPINNNVPSSSNNGSNVTEADPTEVEEFSIISPVSDQNIWGTGGKLTAKVKPLSPAQQEKYQVQFIIDGKNNKPADASTQVFSGIFRGEHTVKALLVNRYNKKTIKESQTVTFFMHQNSKK